MSITTYPLNGIVYDYADVAQYNCTRQSGVYSADEDFKITISGDRQLTISPGMAWMRISRFVGLSVASTEDTLLDLALADSTRPRIDRVVLRYDAAANSTALVVLQGTAASSPAAPAITQTELVYDLCLAEVYRPAGSTTITTSNITSTVLDESVCGVMRDGVTGIPTAQFLEQASAKVDEELANVGLTHAYMEEKQTAAETAAAAAETQAENAAASAQAADQSATAVANAAATATAEAVQSVTALAYRVDVPASGWVDVGYDINDKIEEIDIDGNTYYLEVPKHVAKYTTTISVTGMTADIELGCIELCSEYVGNADAEAAYQAWSSLDTGDGAVTLTSSTQPTADFAFTAKQVKSEAVRTVIEGEVDDTLAISGAAADAAVTGSGLNALGDKIGEFTGCELLQYTEDGKYINTAASTVDRTATNKASGYHYILTPCSAGDRFTVNGKASTTARLWCFIDGDGNSLAKSAAEAISPAYLIAPANSAYLIVNNYGTATSYKGFAASYLYTSFAAERDTTRNLLLWERLDIPFTLGVPWNSGDATRATSNLYCSDCPVRVSVNTGYKWNLLYYPSADSTTYSTVFENYQRTDFIIPAGQYFRAYFALEAGTSTNPGHLANNCFFYVSGAAAASLTDYDDGKVPVKGEFVHGTRSATGIDETIIRRICHKEPVSYDRDIRLTISDPYMFFVRYYDAEGTYTGASANGSELSIPKGTVFAVVIERQSDATDLTMLTLDAARALAVVSQTETRLTALETSAAGQEALSAMMLRNQDATMNVMAAKKPFYGYDNQCDILTIAHISDVHVDTARYANFIEYIGKTPQIDFAICTGDLVTEPTAAQFATMLSIDENRTVIPVIGNHEKAFSNTCVTDDFILNAMGMASTYYSKSLSDSVRLICLDQYDVQSDTVAVRSKTMHYSQAQIDWFISELQLAETNQEAVLIAMHAPESVYTLNDKAFCQRSLLWAANAQNSVCDGTPVEDIVDAWKNGTSISKSYTFSDTSDSITVEATFSKTNTFVAYMVGHYHADFIAYGSNHADQLYLGVTCGCCVSDVQTNNIGNAVSDLPRIPGTVSEDAFNVYGIDLRGKRIKVARVGASVNDMMKDRKKEVYTF
jgi:hypothetical protein